MNKTSPINKLPKISEINRFYGIKAKKKYGQNFIYDFNILNKIVKLTSPLENYSIIEIGAGPGGLSRAILDQSPLKLIVIEKDPIFIKPLREIEKLYKDKVEIIENDALEINIGTLCKNPTKIIANLPYNISTKLLEKWLPPHKNIDEFILTFQKEVAERIISNPRSKNYSRLSVLSQWSCDASIMMYISPESFTPKPKVDSAVVKLKPKRAIYSNTNPLMLKKITKAAFSKRRKIIKNSLSIFDNIERICQIAGIPINSRAEEVSVEKYCQLSALIKD